MSILDTEESHDRRRDSDQWHLKKEINISHILTTLSVIAGIFIWGGTVETRLAVSHSVQGTMVENLEDINDKMGELVEDLGYLRGQAARNQKPGG